MPRDQECREAASATSKVVHRCDRNALQLFLPSSVAAAIYGFDACTGWRKSPPEATPTHLGMENAPRSRFFSQYASRRSAASLRCNYDHGRVERCQTNVTGSAGGGRAPTVRPARRSNALRRAARCVRKAPHQRPSVIPRRVRDRPLCQGLSRHLGN